MKPKLKRILFALLLLTFGVLAYRTACAIPYYTGMIDKRELYRRGVLDYLEKSLEVDKLYLKRFCELGFGCRKPEVPVGYYVLDVEDIDAWAKKFFAMYDKKYDDKTLDRIFVQTFHAKAVDDLGEYLYIDDNLSTAGTKRVVALHDKDGRWTILYKPTFILGEKNEKLLFSFLSIFVFPGENPDWIRNDIKKAKRYVLNKKPGYIYKIDTCGHVENYDVEMVVYESLVETVSPPPPKPFRFSSLWERIKKFITENKE